MKPSIAMRSGLLLAAAGVGCIDNSPPPPRVPVPSRDRIVIRTDDALAKPLPAERIAPGPYDAPPFEDLPLVTQQMPEQQAFIRAYRDVGSPRIVVFVNRTLDGELLPVNRRDPLLSVEQSQMSSGRVSVENSDVYTRQRSYRHDDVREQSDRFESDGPAEYRRTTEVYLRPGQYDEAYARGIDYEAVETIMTDWLAADGQVTIVSPVMARQRMTDEQVKQLEAGRPQVMSELAQRLGADVLVQVQARPTRQTRYGLDVRLVAEAINLRGGESIARAVVDVPPPLEKTTINRYTRWTARKLMDGMLATWSAAPPTTQP